MIRNQYHDDKNWKIEQIKYFKEYLKSFHRDSKEYSIIQSGIDELEKNL